jgi:DNA-binding NarL/FixJ family response regulator
MGGWTRVYVEGADPIMRAGTVAQLQALGQVTIDLDSAEACAVAILAADQIDDAAEVRIRSLVRSGLRVAVVARSLDEHGAMRAVEAGAVALMRACEATSDRLLGLVRSAERNEGMVPADLLTQLLRSMNGVHENVLRPRGLTFSGLTERELDVLRLVADGHDTREIASELCYSERTIKNLLQDVTRRFGLRNRSHAVAFALRQGLI